VLTVRSSTRLRRAQRQGRNVDILESVIEQLRQQLELAPRHRDHPLSSNWETYRERHVTFDWLLVYRVSETDLDLARLGSHSELF